MTPAFTLAAALTCTGPIDRVIDADTIVVACPQPLTVRLADVDAPETRGPCADLGLAAAWLVRTEFGPWRGFDGITVTVAPRYADRWGRVVADVTIAEGVWRDWTMPDAIMAAAEALGAPDPLRPWPHDAQGRALSQRPWSECR